MPTAEGELKAIDDLRRWVRDSLPGLVASWWSYLQTFYILGFRLLAFVFFTKLYILFCWRCRFLFTCISIKVFQSVDVHFGENLPQESLAWQFRRFLNNRRWDGWWELLRIYVCDNTAQGAPLCEALPHINLSNYLQFIWAINPCDCSNLPPLTSNT